MPAPPQLQKVNPADQAILFMGLNSSTISPQVVDEFAEMLIAPKISTVNGVAQVNVWGASKFAVRAQLDPNQLAARGIGIDEVCGSHPEAQRQSAGGNSVGNESGVHGPGRRPVDERRRIPVADCLLQEWIPGAPG